MKEVYQNIWQQQIPLRGNPLKELNCYIIKGENRNLVVDTGFNQAEGRELLLGALEELGCDLDQTDVFLTHLHVDHSGLVGAIKNPNNKAYTSASDGAMVNAPFRKASDKGPEIVIPRDVRMGFSADDGDVAGSLPAVFNRTDVEIDFTTVAEGDVIDIGGFTFTVVDFAGHTPGQVGLYEPTKKILFPGDHILGKITPNITFWSFEFDALGTYMQNLKKAREMDVDYLFAAHRFYVENHAERVDQLLAHHDRRLAEVLDILSSGEKTVYQVASDMKWDFAGGNFLEFPVTQKFFAAGEAMSHLEHLLFQGKVQREERESVLYYSLA